MALVTIHPTRLDQTVAREVSAHTDRRIERGAEDSDLGRRRTCAVGACGTRWIATRKGGPRERRLGTHFLACSVTTAIVPHVMKRFIDQERPDRLTIKGHLRGIPLSGKSEDAFPSGHALHVGGLASAATLLPAKFRNVVRAAGAVLVTTRVILLAHWLTDVVVGLGLGWTIERAIRHLTKPCALPSSARPSAAHGATGIKGRA